MQDKEITLTVTVNDANLILAALSKLPYEAVSGLVASLRDQGQAQIKALEEAPQE